MRTLRLLRWKEKHSKFHNCMVDSGRKLNDAVKRKWEMVEHISMMEEKCARLTKDLVRKTKDVAAIDAYDAKYKAEIEASMDELQKEMALRVDLKREIDTLNETIGSISD